ncbi:MAG: hypothetical protein DWI58_12525 [Chloroflexi bacterium]|nr:MAG: hypothetical protein DWI58_12525 [Chloroflexota bacterium]
MTESPVESRCSVCGLAAPPMLLQHCFNCGEDFHLNPYSNRDGIDCGEAMMMEDNGAEFGVDYFCEPCVLKMLEKAGFPRVR